MRTGRRVERLVLPHRHQRPHTRTAQTTRRRRENFPAVGHAAIHLSSWPATVEEPRRSRGGAEEGRAAPPSKGPPSTRSEQHQPPRATITDDGRLGLGGTWGWLALPAARGQPGLCLLITRHVTTAREARPPDHAPNNTITDPVPDNGSLRYTFNYTDHFVKLLLFAITRALITYSRPE